MNIDFVIACPEQSSTCYLSSQTHLEHGDSREPNLLTSNHLVGKKFKIRDELLDEVISYFSL